MMNSITRSELLIPHSCLLKDFIKEDEMKWLKSILSQEESKENALLYIRLRCLEAELERLIEITEKEVYDN